VRTPGAAVARLAAEHAGFEFEVLRYAREPDSPDWLVVRVAAQDQGRLVVDQVGELTAADELRRWAEGVLAFAEGDAREVTSSSGSTDMTCG
jgi:hypothetical protein